MGLLRISSPAACGSGAGRHSRAQHPAVIPVLVGSPGPACRCHLSSTAHPTTAPAPAFGDGKDNCPQICSWRQEEGQIPLSSPSGLCQGDPTASDALPGHSRPSPSLHAYASLLCLCSEGSCHPNPGWVLSASPKHPWALKRRVCVPGLGKRGDATGTQPSSARLGRASLPAAASPRPPATCGGSAAGTIPPRQLRGAAKPQKCALNKPAPLNEDSSCPIKSEASLSSATPRRDRTGVPGWDAAPARGDEDVLIGTQGFGWLWSPHVAQGHSIPACRGEGSREGEPQGKAKRPLQHLTGSIPCPLLLARLCQLQPRAAWG